MKNGKLKTVLTVAVILLIFGIVALYVYDVAVIKTPYTKNLFKMIAVVFMLLGTLVRLTRGQGRRSLVLYEKAFEKELGAAFNHKPFLRKKLLCACRLYDESNYRKALKYLFQLLKEADFSRDAVPVYLFIALCFRDAHVYPEAIKAYYEILKLDPSNARIHSNLGYLLISEGDYDQARKHFDRSIELDPNNYYAYNNRADYFFRIEEYQNAIADAQKALEVKNNGVEAANLLTIIYAMLGDEENRKKYYHTAITSGSDPTVLQNAIAHYLSENQTEETQEEEETTTD